MNDIQVGRATIKGNIDIGQIVQIATMLLTIGSFIWYEGAVQEGTRKDVSQIRRDITILKDEVNGINLRIAKIEVFVSAGQVADEIQKERMSGLVKSTSDLRDSFVKIMGQVNVYNADIAVIKNTLAYLEKQGAFPFQNQPTNPRR